MSKHQGLEEASTDSGHCHYQTRLLTSAYVGEPDN